MITLHSLLLSLPVAMAVTTTAVAAPAPAIPDLITQAAHYQSGESIEPLRQLEGLTASATTDPTLRAQLEAGLIRLLSPSTTYEARKFACEQLAIIGSETSVPALADMLDAPDTVAIACLALGPNPSPMADDVLRNGLPRALGQARLQIIHALGNRLDRQAVPLLSGLSRDRDPATAEAAIIALGKIADLPARHALEALRKETPSGLALAIDEATLQSAEQLVAAGNPRAAVRIYENLLASAETDHVRRGALEAVFPLDRDGGEKRMLAVLRGKDTVLKPIAIAAIVTLPNARVSQRFGRELPGLGSHEQVLLVEALAARADGGALDVIRAQVENENQAVRVAAIQAIGQLGDQTAVPLLAQALSVAGTSAERTMIERALAGLPGGEATDRALIDALRAAAPSAKPHLMQALAQRRVRLAVPALIEEAGSPTPAVARAAFQALNRLVMASDLPALLDRLAVLEISALRADAEATVVRALVQVEPVGRRWDLLRQRLDQAGDPETRRSLLRLLPYAPDPAARARLERAVQDSDPEIADTALRALADWPDAGAWDALARVYGADTSEAHRILALRGLVRLLQETVGDSNTQLIGRYGDLFDGVKRDEDRKLILGALGSVAHPDALALALKQLENPAVRAEAELAVRQVAESIKDQHPDAAQAAFRRLED